ncbi:hypothetical protein AWENTII_009751 [Aspergillus wentii]
MAIIKPGMFSWEDVLAQRYQSNKPNPLPKSRRRTLQSQSQSQSQLPKPSSPSSSDSRFEYDFQTDSSLLAKLSPELRLIIWEYVMGGKKLHIVQRPRRRMGCVVCPRTGSCEICQGGLPTSSRSKAMGKSDGGLLALSLTCKQIYSESIHMLYTLNTFEFSTTWSLPYLRPTIPTHHWTSIRHIELRWAFPGHWLPSKDPVKSVYFSAGRQQWVETCQALASIAELQTFTLHLTGNWFCESVEKIPVFLEPLRGLGGACARVGVVAACSAVLC